MVEDAASNAGPTFGRKMLTGYLKASGVEVGERVVRRYLPQANPQFAQERRMGVERQTNPHLYYAEYPGHKLHMDQNEKLVEYGVTLVCAIDGYSKFITGFSVMPIKNNVTIYDEVYHASELLYGLPDHVRVDFGKEFYLTLYQQENIMHLRNNLQRPPYIQTPSTQNHVIERMWVEFNSRIVYPLKFILAEMKNNEELDLSDPVTRFCVSTLTGTCYRVGMETTVQSWNYHMIPGKGQPKSSYQALCQAKRMNADQLPPGHILAKQYNREGGNMTLPCTFGEYTLKEHPHLQMERETLFNQHFPSAQELMTSAQELMTSAKNRNTQPFHDALLYYINVTRMLSNV